MVEPKERVSAEVVIFVAIWKSFLVTAILRPPAAEKQAQKQSKSTGSDVVHVPVRLATFSGDIGRIVWDNRIFAKLEVTHVNESGQSLPLRPSSAAPSGNYIVAILAGLHQYSSLPFMLKLCAA
jgi:hypothetical protein